MTAHRESIRVAPHVDLVVIIADDGGARLELVYQPGLGEEPQPLTCMPVPAGALAQVGALLVRAGEQARA